MSSWKASCSNMHAMHAYLEEGLGKPRAVRHRPELTRQCQLALVLLLSPALLHPTCHSVQYLPQLYYICLCFPDTCTAQTDVSQRGWRNMSS